MSYGYINMLVDIKGYAGLYKVDENGNVYSCLSSKYLKPSESNTGYYRVMLYKNGARKRISVHRLVAMNFIEQDENKKFVNHIDSNRKNNHVSNLEWCDMSRNNQHAYDVGNQNHTKRIHATRMRKISIEEASEICEAYETGLFSQREMAKYIGISQSQISRLLNRKSYEIVL